MRPISRFAAILALGFVSSGRAIADEPPPPNDLVVHEWGTFLSMSGSDGVVLDGMYHEEHALPSFVHARSRDQLHLRSTFIKGETPVIYFYTKYPRQVRVQVEFEAGLWTQWYPQVRVSTPSLTKAVAPQDARHGTLFWIVNVTPPDAGSPPKLPATSADALWNYSREVDAAYVQAPDTTREPAPTESERFLFYRGLGTGKLPLEFAAKGNGTISVSDHERFGVRHVFVMKVENGRGAFAYRDALSVGESAESVIPSMDKAEPLEAFKKHVADALAARLVESGLYAKEARAMVNTWSTSYFGTDGVRALYILPQAWTDKFVSLDVSPQPVQTVRVMVGRVELLTPEREQLAEAAVRDLASKDEAVRERAFKTLQAQGRYVEPIVKRVRKTTQDARVRVLCDRLLATDFVTELRSAVNAPADGRRVEEPKAFARARLASLLHDLGLETEAQRVAKSAQAEFGKLAMPPLSDSRSRQYLRAYAWAAEATGDDSEAERWYGRFIDFASQEKTEGNRSCVGCHDGTTGPTNMAFFRDWWAGDRYAAAIGRIGHIEDTIASLEEKLAQRPEDVATRMRLAYLYRAAQKPEKAADLWKKLEQTTNVATTRAN